MKKNSKIQMFLVLFILICSDLSFGQGANNFKIVQTENYGESVLQISALNSVSNSLGTIQIFDLNQKLIKEVKNIELIKSPFYTTISIQEIPSGNYQVKILTSNSVYNQNVSLIK